MTTSSEIIITASYATINLTTGESIWNAGEWTPKRSNKVARLIELHNNGVIIIESDFE